MQTLAEALHPDELLEHKDMGLVIYSEPIDGEFKPESRAVRILMGRETAPDEFEEFAEVDWALEVVDSTYDDLDGEEAAVAFIAYINNLIATAVEFESKRSRGQAGD